MTLGEWIDAKMKTACKTCAFQKWNRTTHRWYCDNPASVAYKQAMEHYETCASHTERRQRT